jgi:integrase
MARRTGEAKLDTRTARRKLDSRNEPYWNSVQSGLHVGYRRNEGQSAGVWYARFTPRKGEGILNQRKVFKRLGSADDTVDADQVNTFTYEQAKKQAVGWLPTATDIATGEKPRGAAYTVEQALKDYLREHIAKRRPRSLETTTYISNALIVPFLGSKDVNLLKARQIEAWLNDLVENPRRKPRNGEEEDSPEALRRRKDSGNRYLTVLKAALTYALSHRRITCDDAAWRFVKPFKAVARARTRFLNDAEARTLVEMCEPLEFRLLVRAALYSGCRYGELSRLNVEDFHAKAGTLFVAESKSGRPRTVYLDSEGILFFSALCEGKKSSDAILRKGDGKRWDKDDAKGMMDAACKGGAIEPCTIHELRHTAASRWIQNGLSLPEVAEQLGHSDIRMVSRHYGHLSKATLAKRMRAMRPLGIPRVPRVREHSPARDQRTTIQ